MSPRIPKYLGEVGTADELQHDEEGSVGGSAEIRHLERAVVEPTEGERSRGGVSLEGLAAACQLRFEGAEPTPAQADLLALAERRLVPAQEQHRA